MFPPSEYRFLVQGSGLRVTGQCKYIHNKSYNNNIVYLNLRLHDARLVMGNLNYNKFKYVFTYLFV